MDEEKTKVKISKIISMCATAPPGVNNFRIPFTNLNVVKRFDALKEWWIEFEDDILVVDLKNILKNT